MVLMKIIVIKEDTDKKEEENSPYKTKINKCIACGEEFTTQLRCERKKSDDNAMNSWHLKCLYAWLKAQVEQRKKALSLFEKDLEVLEKYKDEMMLEELAK
jgi:hypothetical protein